MVERVIHQLVDDLDGSDITDGDGETIDFGVRGVSYRIDLSSTHVKQFYIALQPYMEAATKLRAVQPKRVSPTPPERDMPQYGTVRRWARKNGFHVADRGRIRADIIDAFNAAH